MVFDTFQQALDKVKGVQVKSYGQLCSIARALDVVGDRWTLLIVRELLIGGALRFGEVQRGLPGIATNLLTQRLRDLENNGVVAREPAPGNPGTPTYRLTERGRALDGVLRELLKWGAPTVPDAPSDAIFQMHWLSQPARFLLADHRPDEPPIVIRFSTFDDGFEDAGQHENDPRHGTRLHGQSCRSPGTDPSSGEVVTPVPRLPEHPGQIQGRSVDNAM